MSTYGTWQSMLQAGGASVMLSMVSEPRCVVGGRLCTPVLDSRLASLRSDELLRWSVDSAARGTLDAAGGPVAIWKGTNNWDLGLRVGGGGGRKEVCSSAGNEVTA